MLKDKQRQLTQQLIMDTAISLFRQKGYGNVPVEEITREIGIAKGTFYTFYKSKRDVLMEWSEARFSSLDFRKALERDQTAEENIVSLMGIVLEAISSDPDLFTSFLTELTQLHQEDGIQGRYNFIQLLLYVLRHSSDCARIGQADIELKARVLNMVLFGTLLNWMQSGLELTLLEEHMTKVVRICVNGIHNREVSI